MGDLKTLTSLVVPRTKIGMDYDANPDGKLPSASCLPKAISNDRAEIVTRVAGGRNAYCYTMFSEAGGVVSKEYETCIKDNGEMVSYGYDGGVYAPAKTDEGKNRMIILGAQSYDCFELQEHPNEFARYLWNNAINVSPEMVSKYMHFFQPQMAEIEMPVDVDIDSNGLFPPTVGAVTADARMSDDAVHIQPYENDSWLGICAMFNSEVKPPYGNGKAVGHGYSGLNVCLMEDGSFEVYDTDGDTVETGFDPERMRMNFGTVINSYFFERSENFVPELLGTLPSITMPGNTPVKEGDAIEEVSLLHSALRHIIDSQIRMYGADGRSPGM